MDTMGIWRFDTSEGVESALRTTERLQTRRLVTIDDAAVVMWRAGARRPRGYQVGTAAGTTALSGAFWGLLFGHLLLLPMAGEQETADVLARIGLTDGFLAETRARVTPGTSALFLIADAAAVKALHEAFTDGADLLVRTLHPAHEAALRRAFAADETDESDGFSSDAAAR